jgi:nucleoside-diphosphate-sugar epimerase
MTTTLVTGATGFVGRAVVDRLLAQGKVVRALIRDTARARELQDRGVSVITGDIRDSAAVEAAVRGTATIHHCAAAVGSHFSKREIYDTNLGGVRTLLQAVQRQGSGRVVLLSSINVLGSRNLDPATEDLPCRRSHDPAADVKIEAEALALECHRRHGMDVTILRPGMIYGPGEPHNVPRLGLALLRGKFAFLGSRDHLVPIVHVSDVAEAMLLAAATPAASGRIYHVADGSRTTIGQFVDRLAELLDSAPPAKVLPLFLPRLGCLVFEVLGKLHLRRRPAPINRAALRFLGTSRFVDISRAREELGYAPRVGYQDGLADTVQHLGGIIHELRTAVAGDGNPARSRPGDDSQALADAAPGRGV